MWCFNKLWIFFENEVNIILFQSGFYSDCSLTVMKGATLSTPHSTGSSVTQLSNTQNYIDDPERPESINNCTMDEVLGDFLRAQHEYLTSATVDINKVWWYDLPEAKNEKEEWKLQSWLYSDCSLTVMKGATLSTPDSTGFSGIQF